MRLRCLIVLATLVQAACAGIGPSQLRQDQLAYATALSDEQKRQVLFNVVRLRYGDVPVFLSASQIIAGYTLEAGAEASVNAYPNQVHNNFAGAQVSANYIDHPTFTFNPVTGEQFAQSYIRPLSPAQLLPLAQGLPIDVLLRLGVQSIGDLQNSNPLNGPAGVGSPGFFQLIADLRKLQQGSGLALRFEKSTPGKGDPGHIRVFAIFLERDKPEIQDLTREVRRLLGIDRNAAQFEVVYGYGLSGPNQVSVLTRPILAMLLAVGSQIDVPEEDVAAGRALQTVSPGVPSLAPVIRIRNGPAPPPSSFVSLSYHGHWFWIDDDDFGSKAAVSTLRLLQSIAESGNVSQAPIVTIPAG